MKQRITAEQLQELTTEQQEKLREWWKPQKGDAYFDKSVGSVFFGESIPGYDPDHYSPGNNSLPLLTIGQCFELLKQEDRNKLNDVLTDFKLLLDGDIVYLELCDAFWEAVKSIL